MKMDYPAGDTGSPFCCRGRSKVLTQLKQLIFNKRGLQLLVVTSHLSVQVQN